MHVRLLHKHIILIYLLKKKKMEEEEEKMSISYDKLWVLFLDSTHAQVETSILGLILIVWWTGLGSSQLY